MRVFFRLIRRKPFVWSAFLLALILAVMLCAVGVSAWSAIHRQIDAISDNFVTIAIMNDRLTRSNAAYGTAATAAALDSGCVLSVDSRCLLGADISGTCALTSGAADPLDYKDTFDWPSYCTAVFAIRCTEVETAVDQNIIYQIEDGVEKEIKAGACENYTVHATIEEIISLADGYTAPKAGEAIDLMDGAYNEDGSVPFESGKTYLVFGHFDDHAIIERSVEATDPVTGEFYWKLVKEPDTSSPYALFLDDSWRSDEDANAANPDDEEHYTDGLIVEDYYLLRLLGQRDDGIYYYYQMPECLPHFAEYTGDVTDFLDDEAGRAWREELIPLCERNHRSASVVLTDNLQSIYMFNNGLAEVIEGREFASEDYDGAKVCLISAEYAKYNHLSVGDNIEIDYYKTAIEQTPVVGDSSEDSSLATSVRHGVLLSENRIGVTEVYEIIGIYSAPAFRGGTQLFATDTLFVPKASVPNAERYEAPGVAALQSFVLRNGSEEQFFDALKHCDYAGENAEFFFDDPTDIDFSEYFMTFNQQYDKTAGNISVMRGNARRLLLVSLLGFAVVLAAVRYFAARQRRATVVTMKKLGIARRRIRRELIGAGLALDLAATAGGAASAWYLFDAIAERAKIGTIRPTLGLLLLVAVGIGAVLILTDILDAIHLSRIELMQVKG